MLHGINHDCRDKHHPRSCTTSPRLRIFPTAAAAAVFGDRNTVSRFLACVVPANSNSIAEELNSTSITVAGAPDQRVGCTKRRLVFAGPWCCRTDFGSNRLPAGSATLQASPKSSLQIRITGETNKKHVRCRTSYCCALRS